LAAAFCPLEWEEKPRMQTACVNIAYAKNKLPCATIPNRSGIWFVADVDIGHLTGAAMNKRNTEECLRRAAECGRQAEAARDPELKLYLMKLTLSWTQAAVSELTERQPEDA
jgi:hypothetical protein